MFCGTQIGQIGVRLTFVVEVCLSIDWEAESNERRSWSAPAVVAGERRRPARPLHPAGVQPPPGRPDPAWAAL